MKEWQRYFYIPKGSEVSCDMAIGKLIDGADCYPILL
jgi:hypothetical protein